MAIVELNERLSRIADETKNFRKLLLISAHLVMTIIV